MKKIIQISTSIFILCLLVIFLISISPDFSTDPKTTLIQDHDGTKFGKVIQCLTNKGIAFEVAQDQNKPTEIRVDKEVYKKAKGCL
jgi:flagellar biosynthesis/type III secretory pathway M-ring protein FliF/YscJ